MPKMNRFQIDENINNSLESVLKRNKKVPCETSYLEKPIASKTVQLCKPHCFFSDVRRTVWFSFSDRPFRTSILTVLCEQPSILTV